MNLKLSYRDKVIFIVVMVILVLVAGFFLLIRPKFEQVELAKETLAQKQQEKADIDAKIDTLPIIIDNLKATAEEIFHVSRYGNYDHLRLIPRQKRKYRKQCPEY